VEFSRQPLGAQPAQTWIDKHLPVCPLCKSLTPWATANGADQLAVNRWYFRCPSCKVVLSTIPDVTVSALSPPLTVVKTPLTRDVRVESVGRAKDQDFVGEEFPLSELQEWAAEG
jgi:hypothetical protein